MRHERKSTNYRSLLAILCAIILVPGDTLAFAPQQSSAPASSPGGQAAKIPPEQLDSLVAPIALYPDPLVAQVLAASTYPLEIVQLQRWLEKNKNLKDKALADAVAKQPWDPSVQALAPLPDLVKRLGDEIKWTDDLGNAFLAQQSDVMDAIQRMRNKAQNKGTLQTTEQQRVETKVIENKSVIVIEPANPQVVYVPSYDPVVVYGAAPYPYPPIYYPPVGAYAATAAVSFGVGMMMGAFWGGGGGGWGCGWGGNNVYVNHNNNFNRNTNINGGNRTNIGSGNRSNWSHSPEHRGGAPYRDRSTADKFGGAARGDSLSQRRGGAEQRNGRQGGNIGDRGTGAGAANRTGGAGVSNRAAGSGTANRGDSSALGGAGRTGGADRAGGSGIGGGGRSGGADRVGSRDVSRGGGGDRSAFGGGSGGFNGSSARGASSRGSSSAGSRGGGGGGARGGGGGGGRGGGGRRR